MKDIVKCIENLRVQFDRHSKDGLKEYPTRTIFIDPLLAALGWDVRDPDEVELEHPTVDGKSVDYAMKVNRKVVLHLEAKQLGDPLDDVKSITQVVGYAANNGIEWCVLTNGCMRRRADQSHSFVKRRGAGAGYCIFRRDGRRSGRIVSGQHGIAAISFLADLEVITPALRIQPPAAGRTTLPPVAGPGSCRFR